MRKFEGRTAVVTGAASGIGRATAIRFAEEGMKVVLADWEADPLAESEEEIARLGGDVVAIRCDVRKWESVQELARRSVERFGAVHVVHNNAGVVTSGPMWDLSLDDWNWTLDVNLWGVIYGIKAFVPLIRQAGEGHVINTASIAGLESSPAIAPYNVSKFGVVAASETLLHDLRAAGDENVGVSVLCPGAVRTRIVDSERNREADAEHANTPEEERFLETSGAVVSQGIDPAEVAGMICRAVRERRFWILTHSEWKGRMRARTEHLLRGDLP